jgi:N-acetylglucosaminyldiphosphoundecaprenol N-acetyl-beta-D-mannosaminyltransferase
VIKHPHNQKIKRIDHLTLNHRVNFFGMPVVDLKMGDLVSQIEDHLVKRESTHIINLNPHHFLIAQRDVEFARIFEGGDTVFTDGIGIAFASHLGGKTIQHRYTGLDLMSNLCALSAEKGYSVFLFGGQHGIVERCAENLQKQFPGLRIAGALEPPHAEDIDEFANHGIIQSINEAHPDLLFVALGAPKQEKWIERYRDRLTVPIMMGVGGSFDILGGRFARAPRWMRAIGLEWLFRLAREPRRLSYRYLIGIPQFIFLILRLKIQSRKQLRSS